MKGLVLKVKLIYVTSARSHSRSVIFRECALRRTAEWSPRLRSYWQDRKHRKTVASSSARQSAGSANSSQGKQLAYRGPRRGGRQAERRRTVHSNDRARAIKPARPRPSTAPGLQVCQWEEAHRGSRRSPSGPLQPERGSRSRAFLSLNSHLCITQFLF